MKRTMIASMLSIALAATSFTATPAKADEDVAKVLAGLVVLGILANSIDKNRRDSAPVTRRYQRPQPGPGYYRPPQKRIAKIAPRSCLRSQWTHNGNRQVYGARCMQQTARAQLPQSCLRKANTRSGPTYFYTKRCLSSKGWRI